MASSVSPCGVSEVVIRETRGEQSPREGNGRGKFRTGRLSLEQLQPGIIREFLKLEMEFYRGPHISNSFP